MIRLISPRLCRRVLLLVAIMLPPTTLAATLPSGFQESVVFSGLTLPTAVRFASDGRVFVAEKSGLIKVFDSLADTSPTIFADLRTNVHNFWDRGLLGLALHPNFPLTPYVYVLYTYDGDFTHPAPRWGTVDATSDGCPTPPGATEDGCVVTGRLSRLQASGNTWVGPEQVLLWDWCQQYPSHSVGTLAFGPDGALYVSGGEGASFNTVDYGQFGSPLNPCGDPPSGTGGIQMPPTAEGGALRSQDLRTMSDPVGLDGSILRVDADTGAGLPGNPLASSTDANARRIIAYGLRNPFRFTTRPGTNQIWIGDVGAGTWEEINVLATPTPSPAINFGWPCYEGAAQGTSYDPTTICAALYTEQDTPTGAIAPFYAYNHSAQVVAGETCPTGRSAISGLAFYPGSGGTYPNSYSHALFFADYSRDCIWVMFERSGVPDPATLITFVAGAANPVELQIGPDGDLFYVDLDGGTIRRIQYGCSSGHFLAEYFDNLTLSGTPVGTACEDSISNNWGAGGPAGLPADNFSVRWTGRFTFAAGTTTFVARADDGIRVFVDGVLIIDGWRDQPATTYTARPTLTAGEHEVRVEYYEKTGGAVAQVSWTSDGATPPTLTTLSPSSTPAGGPPFTLTATGTNFISSATLLWNGAVRPTTFVSSTQLTASIAAADVATAGFASVTVRNPDAVSNALTLTITSAGPGPCPTGQFSAQYFNNITLSGTPVRTACEASINYNWGADGPAGLPADNFSVRWTGRFSFPAGTTTFVARADDGIRVFVDGVLIIDGWRDQPATTYTARPTLTAGEHEVHVEYYEKTGGAVAQLSWTSCPTGQFSAQYFNNLTLSGTPVGTACEDSISNNWGAGGPAGLPADNFSVRWTGRFTFAAGTTTFVARADDGIRVFVDGVLIIDGWRDQPATTYTARPTLTAGEHEVRVEYYEKTGGAVAQVSWTSSGATPPALATLSPSSTAAGGPAFTLTATGTNFIPGATLLWNGAVRPTTFVSSTQLTASIAAADVATAGFASVTVRNPDAVSNALTLTITSAGSGPCPTGQFSAQYFNNITLSGPPVRTACEASINNNWDAGGPAELPADNFSVRWTGRFTFAAGTTTFTARADDGIRVFVDGVLIIDGWRDQPATTYTARPTLTAGEHEVHVEYYEKTGGAVAQVSWTNGAL